MDLPIRLAVALLKDTHGNIESAAGSRQLPQQPEFSVMPIVWQTLRNLVLRAAQAPFKLYWRAGQRRQRGRPQHRALQQGKPARQHGTERTGHPGQRPERNAPPCAWRSRHERPEQRWPPFAVARLEREYQSTWYKILQRRGDDVPADANELVVDEDDKAVLLEGIYRARLKQQPPAEWSKLNNEERTAQMSADVLQSWAQSRCYCVSWPKPARQK